MQRHHLSNFPVNRKIFDPQYCIEDNGEQPYFLRWQLFELLIQSTPGALLFEVLLMSYLTSFIVHLGISWILASSEFPECSQEVHMLLGLKVFTKCSSKTVTFLRILLAQLDFTFFIVGEEITRVNDLYPCRVKGQIDKSRIFHCGDF